MMTHSINAIVDYEDRYVQPLLLLALKKHLPAELLLLGKSSELTSHDCLLQWRQYESLDFDHLLAHPKSSLANSYIIRKALIRKHYLSTTVQHWIAKHPQSPLKGHVKPAVEFEVDYAEFLDDALDQAEAWELRESWKRSVESGTKEWWILKPGMSERGQGIRLFSSEEELQQIFEGWDPDDDEDGPEDSAAVMTSHLRHFIAQPYIDPPILLPPPHPSAGRKFHIRTYVLAVGALEIYVYTRMLALFAAEPYTSPEPSADLSKHLTNTCLQDGTREGSVAELSSLPGIPDLHQDWKNGVFHQICDVTGEVFEAAARSMSIHFQPLPNAFEIFGLDFLIDAKGKAWLLEVNAFPDFAQTGDELQGLVEGLFEGVVETAVKPFFGLGTAETKEMRKVLDIDLGRRS